MEEKECELCAAKAVTGFQVGKQATFYSCSAHTSDMAKICAPYGDAIGKIKLRSILNMLEIAAQNITIKE